MKNKQKAAKSKKPATKKAVPKTAAAKTKPKQAAAKKPARKAKTKPNKAAKPVTMSVNVTLNEHCQPLDRADRYEDPLFAALEKAKLGTSGDGGGTLCSKDGEIEEADFDADITSPEAIPAITQFLEAAGAAKGSKLRYQRGGNTVEVPFGLTEGVAIYLDGVTQAPEVYATSTAEGLLDLLEETLGDDFDFRGSWQGPRETALYLYGLSAERMFAAIEPVLRAYPLSRNARVIVGYKSGGREVHLGKPVASA